MTKKERMKKMINKQEIDYLPSYIEFSDRTRDPEIHKALGLSKEQSLEDYLENHIFVTLSRQDVPLFFRNDIKWMKELEKEGYCKVDVEGGVIYDSWGMGVKIGEDGFFSCFHPLEKKLDMKFVEKWMPERIHKACMADTLEERIKLWTPPDPSVDGNFSWAQEHLDDFGDDFFMIPSGYFGIYERAYGIASIPALFENMLLNPTMVGDLLEKITNYKIQVAEKFIEMGFDCGHMGDDLGTQVGPFMSPAIFKDLLVPQYKRLWGTYKDAGLPMAMHSCGCITEFIPDLVDLGLDMLNPVQPCMDQDHLKKEFGNSLTFWGGIDTQHLLPHGTIAEVKAGTIKVMETLGSKGGGLVVAPSQEVMNDVPLDNVVAMLETIVEHRERVLSL